MGKYNTIRSDLWTDEEVRKLSLSGKLLYHYLLSSPLSNLAGFYRLPKMQIKTDLCRLDENCDFASSDTKLFKDEILPTLKDEKKLWKYDDETQQVFIPTYLKYNKVGGDKQLKAINTAISTLTICPLHIDFMYCLLTYVGTDVDMYIDRKIRVKVFDLAEKVDSEEATFVRNNLYIGA